MGLCELEAIMGYIVSSRIARATQKDLVWGWRDGSAVKSKGCSLRGHEFNFQQPHGSSQTSIMGSDIFPGVHEDSVLIYIQ